jgi:peptidoglycan/xylan/chitin deacetylase (PgdA/CDA1 family)
LGVTPKQSLAKLAKSPILKQSMYYSGALEAYHRHRNRDRLTVIMFHRVLTPTDSRWSTADPEYTLRDDLFVDCLAFFKRHYHVIGLDQLLAARAGGPALPSRPLLITFDDGWADNEEHALAHLRHAGLPSVLFVAADAIGRLEPFYQERLIGAWKAGRLDPASAAKLWRDAGGDTARTPALAGADRNQLEPLRAVIAQVELLADSPRRRLMAELAPVLDDGVRYMVTSDQLGNLAGHFVAIGAHGKTHTPMTQATDLDAELSGARTIIAERLGTPRYPPIALSFPHGAHDAAVVTRAHAAGYQLLFTSVPELPSVRGSGPGVLGRVGFTDETITDRHGRFAPELLALHLFRKPHAST